MTPATQTPVIGLARVSTAEQEESGAGLDAQEEAIRSFCASKGWPLVDLVREAASGKTLAKRPELKAVLARLEDTSDDERPRALVVAKMDRLARSMLDYATLVQRAQRNGWSLVVLDPPLDFTTPHGRAMANVLMTFAEYERELIGERTRAGMREKKRQGVRFGRPRAMPAATLRRLRELRREGHSLRKVAEIMNQEGLKGPHGGRWENPRVHEALKRYGMEDE